MGTLSRRAQRLVVPAVTMMTSVAVLVLPAMASAVTYVERTVSLPNPGQGSLKAQCPKGSHVLGGGQYVFSGDQEARLDTSTPFDGKDRGRKPDDGWRSSVRSFDADNRLDVVAVCGQRQPTYVQHAKQVGGLSPRTALAQCPRGTHVTGGGVRLPVTFGDDGWIETSSPADTGDRNLLPDDGWTATGGVGERNVDMTVTAICGPGKLKYRSDEGTADPSTYGEAAAICPDGTQITGGGVQTDGLALVALTISSPFDSASDPDAKPDDGWQGEADNYSVTNQAFVNVWAICRA